VELEKQGSIFGGRDEKGILLNKREAQAQEMKNALQQQIEEKARKKENEKRR
jgi:hypothetical protein